MTGFLWFSGQEDASRPDDPRLYLNTVCVTNPTWSTSFINGVLERAVFSGRVRCTGEWEIPLGFRHVGKHDDTGFRSHRKPEESALWSSPPFWRGRDCDSAVRGCVPRPLQNGGIRSPQDQSLRFPDLLVQDEDSLQTSRTQRIGLAIVAHPVRAGFQIVSVAHGSWDCLHRPNASLYEDCFGMPSFEFLTNYR